MTEIIFTYDFNKVGGIENVTKDLISHLRDQETELKIIEAKGSLLRKILSYLLINLYALMSSKRIICMHPFLFQRVLFSRAHCIVFAYGIEVWGNYGKQKCSRISRADSIITISNFTKNEIIRNFPDSNVHIVNLPIRLKPRESTLIPNRKKRNLSLLTVSRLSQEDSYKGHDITIRAVANLKKSGIQVQYNIVGNGDDRFRLEELVRSLNVADVVKFHGFVDEQNLSKFYENADIFIMVSNVVRRSTQIWSGEGLGLVYLDAASYSIPIIAGEEGGQTDCVIDEYNGVLIPSDVNKIEEAILTLIEDPILMSKMGNNGRLLVTQKYSYASFKQKVDNILEL